MESAINGARAYEAGRSSLTARRGASSRGGPGATTAGGKYVVIYKRVNNEWKIAYDIFNDD
jgi:ketosteroid isomerase-like protein